MTPGAPSPKAVFAPARARGSRSSAASSPDHPHPVAGRAGEVAQAAREALIRQLVQAREIRDPGAPAYRQPSGPASPTRPGSDDPRRDRPRPPGSGCRGCRPIPSSARAGTRQRRPTRPGRGSCPAAVHDEAAVRHGVVAPPRRPARPGSEQRGDLTLEDGREHPSAARQLAGPGRHAGPAADSRRRPLREGISKRDLAGPVPRRLDPRHVPAVSASVRPGPSRSRNIAFRCRCAAPSSPWTPPRPTRAASRTLGAAPSRMRPARS